MRSAIWLSCAKLCERSVTVIANSRKFARPAKIWVNYVIFDLKLQEEEHQTRKTDVLIIGAGIAGLVLATKLRSHNVTVAILESGGREQVEDSHPLNRTVQLGDPYSGASKGRFRCLGGTSTRWGGALIPFSDHDLGPRPYLELPGFPVGMEAIRPYLPEVERFFGVEEGSYDEDLVERTAAGKYIPTGDHDFHARFAKWPPFKNRNLALLFRSRIEQDRDLEIWINATATDFQLEKNSGRLTSVTGRVNEERAVTINAKHIVICAGAIESTRLLLLLDRQYGGRIFNDCKALGRFFNDHISIPVADIEPTRVNLLNRMAGFRFLGSTMRSLRYELSPEAQKRECVGSGFAHISFKTHKKTGFDVLRELMRSRQRGEQIQLGLISDALRDLPYMLRLGFWRFVHRQLLWPVPAAYELHFVAEQVPRAENCIGLSSELDWFGLPLATIRWRVVQEDFNSFVVFQRCFDDFWNRHDLKRVGLLNWKFDSSGDLFGQVGNADVYHPGGSTRMGNERHNAVVDCNLRLFAVSNLWVASTSAFPSGGGENPTLTLILFTLRLGDHIMQTLRAN
jgi:choline dehydrogenase-like flavoprotein